MGLEQLKPEIREGAQALFDLAVRAGVKPRVTSVVRTYAKQKALYEAWISGRARFPAAPPGTSAHEYGYAFDMVVDNHTDQIDIGSVWSAWGGVYGGEEDPVHFEVSGFRTWLQSQGPSVQPEPVYKPDTAYMKARRLVDILLPFLPGWVEGMIGIEHTAAAILELVGVDPAGLRVLDWAMTHPEEFLGTTMDAFRAILLSYL